jgi:hypothetical protein
MVTSFLTKTSQAQLVLFKVPFMDQKAVSALEGDLESAFVSVIMRAVKGRRIPLLPSHRTIHLMAKAAVVVYETAVDVSESEARDAPVRSASP